MSIRLVLPRWCENLYPVVQGHKLLLHDSRNNEYPTPRVYSPRRLCLLHLRFTAHSNSWNQYHVGSILPLNAGTRQDYYNAVAAAYYLDPNTVHLHPTLNPFSNAS